MWKFLNVLLFASLLSVPAFAKEYKCELIDDFDDWRIDIDTRKGIAGFFDNDTWTTLKLVYAGQLETMPPQPFYEFRELDSRKRPFGLRITFMELRGSAVLTENVGKADEQDFAFFCKRVR